MGVEAYVSRRQLPGAAPTRRMALVLPGSGEAPAGGSAPDPASRIPRPEMPVIRPSARIPKSGKQPARVSVPAAKEVRFSLAAIVAGGVLWIEELGGMPLAREQTQLVHAMSRAVSPGDKGRGQVNQFNWPMHNNRQLDQSEEAAREGLVGFMNRLIEEQGCRGLVLLGASCHRWVAAERWPGLKCVRTMATLEMINEPANKRRVWADLQALISR